jgi:hypothetical protein
VRSLSGGDVPPANADASAHAGAPVGR